MTEHQHRVACIDCGATVSVRASLWPVELERPQEPDYVVEATAAQAAAVEALRSAQADYERALFERDRIESEPLRAETQEQYRTVTVGLTARQRQAAERVADALNARDAAQDKVTKANGVVKRATDRRIAERSLAS